MSVAINSESKASIYYPPGGILIWIIIIVEIFTFLGASLTFLYYRGRALEEYQNYKVLLDPIIGTINTVILITSGYFMAMSVLRLRNNEREKSSRAILIALLFGLLFLVIKGIEFGTKLNAGIGLEYNTFFTFYWLMTGFHYVHVLFGVGLLIYMYLAIRKGQYTSSNMMDVESSATYWHMCDLIWILIFPVLYLI